MLKRIVKGTSLLVCAASVFSVVPAKAADIKSYEAQEGTIYYAKALGAGSGDIIYIDGEINGSDDEAVYYMTSDGQYNKLDVDCGYTLGDTGLGRYLPLSDNETVIDTKDGYKIIEENTKADLLDDVAQTARKVLKNDNNGRFAESEFTSLKSSYFISAWSGLVPYSYKLAKPFKTTKAGTVKETDRVYVNAKGEYIDADYNLGNLKVTTTGGTVTMKNTDDTYEITEGNTTYEYRAVLKDMYKHETDKADYFYRWANLSIYRKVKDADDLTYINVTDKVGFGSQGYTSFVPSGATSTVVFQKFSKPSDSDESVDGIKYSKESTLYFVANEEGDSEVVLGYPESYEVATEEAAAKLGITYNSKDIPKITVNDNGFSSGYLSVNEEKVYVQNFKLKSKKGFNYIELGDDGVEDDYDIGCTDTSITSKMYGIGGNICVLDGGYIKVWGTDKKFTKLYKVDGAMDHMSIGNKDFAILWNEDDGLYTIINNKNTAAAATAGTTAAVVAAAATTTSTTAATTVATGWVKAADGTWSYFNASGVMQTGWVNDDGTWYYCDASGSMLSNTTVDGYVLGANGAWIK